MLEQLYNELIIENTALGKNDIVITVKSMDGSQGLGRNPTDREYNSRKGLKVSLICDQNLVTHAVHLDSANIHDAKILPETIDVSITDLTGLNCLAACHSYIDKIEHNHKLHLIAKPKRTRSPSKMNHHISHEHLCILNKYRNRIERLNGNIRGFRGLMIKYTKTIDSYGTYLYFVSPVINYSSINKHLNKRANKQPKKCLKKHPNSI